MGLKMIRLECDDYCASDDQDYIASTELDDLRDLYVDLVAFTKEKPDAWAQEHIDDYLVQIGRILKMSFEQARS